MIMIDLEPVRGVGVSGRESSDSSGGGGGGGGNDGSFVSEGG